MNKNIDISDVEIKEFMDFLNDPEHPDYEENLLLWTMIFSFMKEDFSKEELEKAFQRFYPLFVKFLPITDEDKDDLSNILIVLEFPDVEKKLKKLFYHLLKTDGISGPLLKNYYHLSTVEFIKKVDHYFDTVAKQEIADFEGPKEKLEFPIQVSICRKELLRNKQFVTNLKGQYMLDAFQTYFYRDVSKKRVINSRLNLKSAFMETLKEWRTNDAEFSKYTNTDAGKKEIQATFEQMSNTGVQKYWGQFLRREEEQGFIAYQEAVNHLKDLLFKRIEIHLNISKYFLQEKYDVTKRAQRKQFINEFMFIGPNAVPYIYGSIHETILSEIRLHFISLFYMLPIDSDKQQLEYFKSKLDKLIFDYSTYLEKELQKKFEPFAKQFQSLFDYVGNIADNLKKRRSQDPIRGILSALSPLSLIRNIGRIINEEKSFNDNLDNADNRVTELYIKYKQSLPILEKKLLHFYNNFYEQILKKLFMPLIKNTFHSTNPVCLNNGIENFENTLFTYVKELFYDDNNIKPRNFDSLFSNLKEIYNRDPNMDLIGNLKDGNYYIKPEYFREKTLKIKAK